MIDRLLSPKEAAERLGMNYCEFLRLVANKTSGFPCVFTSDTRFKIHPDELDKWCRNGGAKPINYSDELNAE